MAAPDVEGWSGDMCSFEFSDEDYSDDYDQVHVEEKVEEKVEDEGEYDPNQPSRLLSLAPELRDLIYTFALVEAKNITIKPGATEQPSLLRVNHQIRREAAPIFYQQNIFEIQSDHFDPTGLQVFQEQSKGWLSVAMIAKKHNIFLSFLYTPKWSNVLKWAKGVHDGSIIGGWKPEGRTDADALARIVEVAARLRGLPWVTVLMVLEQMKEVAGIDRVDWEAEG